MIMASQLRKETRLRERQHQDEHCRITLFQRQPATQSNSRPEVAHPTINFYRRDISVEDSPNHWRPGEYISPDPVQNPMEDFHSLVSSMQSSISSQLSKLNGTLATITSRLEKLEESVAVNTAKLNEQSTCCTPHSTPTCSSSACEMSTGGSGTRKRKRYLPTGTSNMVRTVHNNLPDDKKWKKNESIESGHNQKVVAWVAEEMPSSECYKTDIKKALQTYRKTLMRTAKEGEQNQRLKRSRQQKKYERRGKQVRPHEQSKWGDVCAFMMSDEEEVEGKFKVHRQNWRSDEFNNFMDELDARALASQDQTRPRFARYFGTPSKANAPPHATQWLTHSSYNEDCNDIFSPNSPEIL